MKYLIVFAAIIAVSFAQNYTRFNVKGECGKRPIVDGNVVGGVESKNGGHPYIISMEYGTGITKSHSCGGSLINRQWVVTAAHCVSGRNGVAQLPNYRIQIGAHNRASASQNAWQTSRSVKQIIMHPQYTSSNFKNDIALLKLDSPVDYDPLYIQPICVDDLTANIPSNLKGIASGWGSTGSGGSVVQTLREVNLTLTTDAACTSFYGTSYDKTTMVCFGDVGDNKDTCQGDSGGPVVMQALDGYWYLVGITSWGRGCGDIGVYARPSTYAKWISDQLAANP